MEQPKYYRKKMNMKMRNIRDWNKKRIIQQRVIKEAMIDVANECIVIIKSEPTNDLDNYTDRICANIKDIQTSLSDS